MTQLSELLRTWRLPSIPTLALYAATLVAEVPVILARMLITFAVAAIVLLIKGRTLAGAQSLMELALIPTGWSILALITPFGGGWWWLNNMGGRQPSERERAAYHDAAPAAARRTRARPLRLAERVVRDRRATARRRGVREHADALPWTVGERVSPRRARTRARAPRHQRRQAHRRDQPSRHQPPAPGAGKRSNAGESRSSRRRRGCC